MSNVSSNGSGRQVSFRAEHRAVLSRMRDSRTFFIVYHDYITILKLDMEQAFVLSDLHNTAAMAKAEEEDDGWFLYTAAWMEQRTGAKRDAQQRILNALKERGLIDMERRGMPPKRYVRISLEGIAGELATGLQTANEREIPLETDGIPNEREIPLIKNGDSRCSYNGKSRSTYRREETSKSKKGSSRSAAPPPRSPQDEATPDLLGSTTAAKWSEVCARKLFKALSAVKRVQGDAYSSKTWSAAFTRLAALAGQDRVLAVLDWYCANLDRWTVHSAAGFCRSFDPIAGMYDRQQTGGSAALRQKDTQPTVTVSPEAQEVVDDLKTMGWPKGSADQLPLLVAFSHVAMQNLYDKLNDILTRLDRGKVDGIDPTQPAQANVLRTFLERFMADMGQDAESATARWWRDVHKKVAGWRDWSGHLKSYVFSEEHARFKAILREASYSFSHDEDLATLVLREIKRP